MITYEIKINGTTIKRIDARRIHSRNEAMEKTGYEYAYQIYDYESQDFKQGTVTHKYDEGAGKLLALIFEAYTNQ